MSAKAKKKILLVQSAQTQGNSTKRHLEETGYTVFWAGSGISALMMTREQAIDLILLDVALPDIEGLDLCRRFRAREDTHSIPIVLLTQRGYAPERADLRGEGPDDYLEKPYTEQDLDLRISTVLAKRMIAAQVGSIAHALRPVQREAPAAAKTVPAAAPPVSAVRAPELAQPSRALQPAAEQKTALVQASAPEKTPLVPVMKTLQQQAARPELRLVPKPEPVSEPEAAITPEEKPLPPPKTAPAAATPAPPPQPPALPPFNENADTVVDPATGLFGRKQFEAMFSKEYKRSVRFKQQLSCILIDLDGRPMGRKADASLVKEIIGLVNTTIREIDTAAWWTGDAFIIMLPNTLRNDALQAGMRILEAVANHPFTWPDATNVTMSVGVAGLPDKNITTEHKMIEAAIAACKRARDLMHAPAKPAR